MSLTTAFPLVALTCLLATVPALPVPRNVDPLLNREAQTALVPIAILHMYDTVSFFQRLGAVTGENKRRYAARHGYDMIESTPLHTTGILKEAPCGQDRTPDTSGKCWEADKDFDIDHSRAPTFGKIKLSLAACRGRDNGWLLWMDADAMIVNQTIPLETLIDDGYDFMLAYDWLMLNAGMLLMKCSDWMKGFLHNVYDARKFDEARALDQSSFQEHLDNLTEAERNMHVKIVPKYAMNVYTEEYRPGDFLLHMAGKLYEATEPGIVSIAHQFDVLSMADDREDVEAFFRSTHLLNYYSGVCKLIRGQRQADCKPDDPRRLLLNESLGSMSTPNRYRHVGLRYYWLGDWKDKYDVPGWDVKRKTLPLPKRPPHGKEMPPLPLAALHHEAQGESAAIKAGGADTGSQPNAAARKDDDDDDDEANAWDDGRHDKGAGKHDVPEIEHDLEVKPDSEKRTGGNTTDAEDDDDEESYWPAWLKVCMLGLGAAVIGAGIVLYRNKKQKVSKMH